MAMDVKRDPKILKRKRIRQTILISLAGVAAVVISIAVSNLKPAAPTVPNSQLWYGVVKRGPMVREIRGAGTLVPEDIRFITTKASGRVDRIVLQPGAQVKPGTVILVLDNPDLHQQVSDAELSWKAAVASLKNQESQIITQKLSQDNAVANAEVQLKLAQQDLDANMKLAAEGLVADITIRQKQAAVSTAQNALALAKRTRDSAADNEAAQLAPQQATVSQQRARFDQLKRQLDDLQVTSTMSGQLQEVNVQVGQTIGAGTNLARVSDPTRLKAEVRISETQTKDLAIGLKAEIDTRSGKVKGHISRIDPASTGGTVGVDVTLDEALPVGARPAQSVDGLIELQRLDDVLFVESPSFGQEGGKIGVFKVDATGTEAVRTTITMGRRSVQFVEILEGLVVGDKIILSDMSPYDAYDRVRIN